MNWKDANSTEIDPNTPYPVVVDMPEHNPGQMGGTMRLGKRTTIFHGQSISSKYTSLLFTFSRVFFSLTKRHFVTEQLYGNVPMVDERHRHRYEVNPQYVEQIEAAGLRFVGMNIISI